MNQIAKKQKCLMFRNGIEIWLEKDLAERMQKILETMTEHKFITLEGRTVNTADCVGVYLPEDIDCVTRKKNGEWKCFSGVWHQKDEHCYCKDKKDIETKKQEEQNFYRENGYYPLDNVYTKAR